MAATLKLTRKWAGPVFGRSPWEISVDGTEVGSIAVNETKELAVEPGQHVLQVGTGRHISPKRSFDVADGDVASYYCHGAMLWPIYLAALVKPELWITLKPGF